MRIYGLTGQTGGGKTTVGEELARQGFAVIDCDRVSREVVEPGTPCLARLAQRFGQQILRPDGSLDRKKLGDIVFHDRTELAALDEIIYPYIEREIERRIEELRAGNNKGILLDAPTLLESGVQRLCDGGVISVIAPVSLRRARIMARDGLDGERADARIASQHSDEYYIGQSDYLLRNEGSPEELRQRVRELARELLESNEKG
ncbi:dephospho-CoA kinase [Ligaoa zhengdingensis]|uniref:dephospho-CoA kinase n=1 Tax=Ligaoa zhengdingensis TaxID=2763658 RepID=UPI0031B9CC63